MYSPSNRLTELLSSTLGEFFQNVNNNHLTVGLWQGDLTLQDLKLRPDALSRLWPLAPFAVHEGIVGHVQIQV